MSAADGWLAAEGAVGSAVVVVAEPVWQPTGGTRNQSRSGAVGRLLHHAWSSHGEVVAAPVHDRQSGAGAGTAALVLAAVGISASARTDQPATARVAHRLGRRAAVAAVASVAGRVPRSSLGRIVRADLGLRK